MVHLHPRRRKYRARVGPVLAVSAAVPGQQGGLPASRQRGEVLHHFLRGVLLHAEDSVQQ